MQNKLKAKLQDKTNFVVFAELTGGPGFNIAPISKFFKAYKENKNELPAGFDFAVVTAPQNPGGVANIEPVDILVQAKLEGWMDGLDFVPHVSCKDHNTDAIVSSMMTFKRLGVNSVLALTGDKPAASRGVFEVESIGLVKLISNMNNAEYIKAKTDALDKVHQFFIGAAVSPFKYTESSQMQQYYKMEKKIKSGAGFLITQVGWDWKKSLELFRYMKGNNIDVPVIGNVYLLSTITPAPRLMHDIKLPGCFVSDELLSKVYSETVDDHIERAAQQVAMYKAMGAAGVDVGGVHDWKMFVKLLNRAAEIGKDWDQFKDNLCWPAKNAWYLYDDDGKRTQLSEKKKNLHQKCFNAFHRSVLDSDYKGFHAFKAVMGAMGAKKGKGFVYSGFNAGEKAMKYLMFDCQECGDCYLPENFSYCTIGGCEKGLDNAPCGDSTVDGYCGNNLERVCIGEFIYDAAAAEKGGLAKLRSTINKPRKVALEHSSSILNYLFAKDHTMKNAIINIGESVHASIPKTGIIMKELADLGKDAYSKPSAQLDYVKALIESQAADGADYIAVNLDAFGESNLQLAVDMMVEYTKMVRKWGGGVPICVDSSNDDVLKAGLKEWYDTDEPVKKPLLNSVKIHTMDNMFPLKKHFDYSFIGLLVSEDKPTGPGGSHSVDELYNLARTIFDKATEYGFKPDEIFFDSTVFPLAIDMPMEPGVPGYTYRAFETIKKIKTDPAMKGVHCSLGVSNCVRDLPARKVGVCRAYVAKGMEYGLDAGIVNSSHHYGEVEPDAELLKMVDAFAKMDGSSERLMEAMQLMGDFCRKSKKPAK
ncbi:MAG: methylenetetrahydrofolate reductase C-terminal domain-containing protein [Phycisphaerae bacterium]|nr:methylenetetrahydrofolate reductase C-terminal domain-containing protein [Phycisphaerae bacterium]